jgi:diphosphomevalonate decarboxylase
MTQLPIIQAEAFANIALIKYWGKMNRAGNYPAVPSLSLTLSGLRTLTTVELREDLLEDEVLLDGEHARLRPRERVIQMLDVVRARTQKTQRARVTSQNEFPTAAGLASSSSGFAALACASNAAFDAKLSVAEQSSLARAASASAARSLYGGFVAFELGADAAEPLAPPDYWDLVLLVAVTAAGKKPIGSTEAMNGTRDTSPYYPTWVSHAPTLFATAKQAILKRDLACLGEAMEQSTLMMHATMHTARPSIIYENAASLAVIHTVRALRHAGTEAYFTMDAGPHVKVLCRAADAPRVREQLTAVDGVREVLSAKPGQPARILSAS